MKNQSLKIVADQNMPLVEALFGRWGEVRLLPGRSISAEEVADADVLLVRSVTSVSSSLLENSRVKFVGSATIGIDHVDIGFLNNSGIRFAFAPGCNAKAVVQYDLSVMSRLMPNWQNQTVGIIGCGNVGGLLYSTLEALGVSCRVYDPFLPKNGRIPLDDFNEVLQSDIVCLHTPLTFSGLHPTYHLINRAALEILRPDALLINAGRGEVVDTETLLEKLRSGMPLSVALDVWESEPNVCSDLLKHVAIATPHIAGYTLEGKTKGTTMVFDAFLAWLEVKEDYVDHVSSAPIKINSLPITSAIEAILASYDVLDDDQIMRQRLTGLPKGSVEQRDMFDAMRREYPERRGFESTIVHSSDHLGKTKLKRDLAALGFLASGHAEKAL